MATTRDVTVHVNLDLADAITQCREAADLLREMADKLAALVQTAPAADDSQASDLCKHTCSADPSHGEPHAMNCLTTL